MKQCPKCQESFEDEQNFCDIDGTPLPDETAYLRSALQQADTPQPSNERSTSWIVGFVGVVVGVSFSLLVYVFLLMPGPAENKAPLARQQTAPMRSNQVPATLPRETAPSTAKDESAEEPEASPSPSPLPSPSDSASAATPDPTDQVLDDGPISTGDKYSRPHGQALIKLKDGASFEADAVWEDHQGVWYRRGGLVSFLDRNNVSAITARAQAKPLSKVVATP